MMDEILAKHSGQDIDTIRRDSQRDFFMGAQEAKDYGLIDEIFVRDKQPASAV
jgi:ATP-dependent Clp protease protease subunit